MQGHRNNYFSMMTDVKLNLNLLRDFHHLKVIYRRDQGHYPQI